MLMSLVIPERDSYQSKNQAKAEKIIHKAIIRHGGDAYNHLSLKFRFRKLHFEVNQKNGAFEYIRTSRDSTGRIIRDILTNKGFKREIEGKEQLLETKKRNSIKNGVNSVVYFALLPAKLSDPAVIKSYKGKTTIKGQPYHVVEVHFKEEEGGDDFKDTFMYWIHAKHYTMDYLAYQFHTDGGGVRYRSVDKVQEVKGIRFQNYVNYKMDDLSVPMEALPEMWEKEKLKELSRIDLEDISLEIVLDNKFEQ